MGVWTTTLHVWSLCTRVCVVYVFRVRTATVQQQFRSNFEWIISMRVLTLECLRKYVFSNLLLQKLSQM